LKNGMNSKMLGKLNKNPEVIKLPRDRPIRKIKGQLLKGTNCMQTLYFIDGFGITVAKIEAGISDGEIHERVL